MVCQQLNNLQGDHEHLKEVIELQKKLIAELDGMISYQSYLPVDGSVEHGLNAGTSNPPLPTVQVDSTRSRRASLDLGEHSRVIEDVTPTPPSTPTSKHAPPKGPDNSESGLGTISLSEPASPS